MKISRSLSEFKVNGLSGHGVGNVLTLKNAEDSDC